MTIEFLEVTKSFIEVFHSSVPFTSADDNRLKVLKDGLKWLNEWQEEARNAPGTAQERNKMTLSAKTFFDVQSMVLGFCRIVYEATNHCQGTQILAWRINTNLIENIFLPAEWIPWTK